MTDVTIRGIDDDVYARFAAEAKKRGIPIGELTTQVMRDLVEEVSNPGYCINNVDDLEVAKRDLESMDGSINFNNIDVLEFAEDVDWETFKVKVGSIVNVDKVIIPATLTKLQVLIKAKNVSEIRTRKQK
jgi:hypothetical protein